MIDIMKIVRLLEESAFLKQKISEAVNNKTKEEKGIFLSTLLGTLAASISGNALTGEWVIRAGEDKIRACESFEFWNTKYYQNKPKLNGVYSRNNLSKI